MKIYQAILNLWSRHKNCLHIKGNNSKSGKTRVMVHVFYRLMVFNICAKFHKYVKRFYTYGVGMKIVNTQRAITPKVGKPDLCFMCSARRLMVFNVCVKFHENISSGFKLAKRT